jgi:hypothetical protein
MKELSTQMFPRLFIDEQKQRRVDMCMELLNNVLAEIINEDEMYCFQCDKESQRQSMQ